ncbi:hypothetical protein RMB13_06995 [Acinetobacter sp. V102_4]|uniref:hypothetical protein n=1 Tax=Acinetobacter sp. V102_4 TaxID=3072984 RepID=UPI00287CE6D7|nr:hypothetical protein [Acinetobacter sp. V102_4]MDS7929224.1 hypothetical protein [Acinetobacter sp. V102_4]
MATKLGTLTLDLLVRTGKYTEAFRNAEKTTKNSVANITSSISSMKVAWGAVGAAVSIASGLMASKLVAVQREFDVLNAGLITATKSSKDAKIAFDALSQFAKETPYGLSQAVEAFNKLVNLGLTPSEQALMSYGNTASAMGKDLMQLIEAVADASTFEFERLKEFGIKSKQEGDKVKFTFQGVTTEVKKNASDIEQYLIKLGENQFAGAMSERMNTLDGDIAGLEDSWNSLWLSVSQSGVGDLIRVGIQNATTSIDDLTDVVKSGAIETALAGMGKAFNIFSNGVQDDTDDIGINFSELSKHLIQVWQSTINELNAIGNALNIGKSWVQKATVGVAAGWDIITDPFNKQSSNSAKQAAYESSIAAIDAELASKKDAVAKAFKNAEKQLAAYTSKTKESRDVLADYKVKTQDSAKDTENDAKKKREAAKAQAELNRQLEERKRLQNSLIYAFGDREYQMQLDYEKHINDIKIAFVGEQQKQFLNVARGRYETEKDLFLAKLAFELSEYRLTEEEKINFQYELSKKEIAARTDITDKDKEAFYRAAKDKHQQELSWMRLESAQRLNDAQSAFQTDMQNITAKYEFEREQIRLNKSLTGDEKDFLIGASYKTQDLENDDSRRQAWMNYQGAIGVDTSAEDAASQRGEVIQQAFEWQLITQEEYQQRMLESERKYHADRAALGLSSNQAFFGSMVDMLKSAGDEQSAIYKTMFAAEKAFAIASAAVQIPDAMSKALNNPFPANIAAMANVAALGAGIIANIKSVSDVGFATGGYTGNMGRTDIAGVVHGQEYVLNASATKRIGVDTLNTLNSGGSLGNSNGDSPTVNVYTLPGQTATATQNDDGSLDIRIQQIAEQTVSNQLANPNSRISKTMQQNYNAQRRR